MATFGNRSSFSMENLLRTMNSTLEQPVRDHLKQVYSCLMISMLAAAAGAYVHVFTDLLSGNFLTSLAAIGFLVSLYATPDDSGKNAKARIGLLMGFAFFSGLGLGPLLDHVIRINPAIIPTAFLSTSLIFACFSISAMYSPRGQFLLIGAPLMSMFSLLSLLVLANIFIGSALIFQVYLYAGFAVMCGFVLYDTQLIIEKRRLGDKDFIWHSVDLFIDFINVFRHLMVILAQKESNQNKKRKN
jgi:FtsH-binding integral membrane protein